MQVITETFKVYSFNELSEKAKDKAREWYSADFDPDWHESTYERAEEIGGVLGFDNMKINYSGFWSQGDGASFTATWWAPRRPLKAMRLLTESPELLELAERMSLILCNMTYEEREHSERVYRTEHRYSHPNTVSCDNDDILEVARDLMHWIYRSLREEYEYQTSEEQVAEACEANDYTFREDGTRY